MQLPNNGVWEHYKQFYVQVTGIGRHTETGELLVFYTSLSAKPGFKLRARPLDGPGGFITPVVIDGQELPRFVYIGDQLPG